MVGSEDDFVFRMKRGVGIHGDRDRIVYKNVLATYTHIHAWATPAGQARWSAMPSPTDPNEPQPDTPTAAETRAYVLNAIGGRRQPPANLLKRMIRGSRLTRDMVQAAIRELVAAGELAYTSEHGRTFLEPSFDRPVRVANTSSGVHSGKAFSPNRRCVIRIGSRRIFGAGRH
jgi:hypothetical protein